MAQSMTSERLKEIRDAAKFGWMRPTYSREDLVSALTDAVAYIDELLVEYTADPPPEPDAAEPPSPGLVLLDLFKTIKAGDVVACHDTEYTVDGWRTTVNGVRLVKVRRDIGWSSKSSTTIYLSDWLSGAWRIVRRAEPVETERTAEEFDALKAGDRVVSRGVEYKICQRLLSGGAVGVWRTGGREVALSATIMRRDDWLSGAWKPHERDTPSPSKTADLKADGPGGPTPETA